MPFKVKRRGKLTYYYEGDAPVLSALVVEQQPDGDLKLYFSGLTGGTSAASILGRDEVVTMDPEREIPLVFQCWEGWLKEAGICQSIADVDFVEIHAFRAQPKSPNPLADPEGYARELARLRDAYSRAYGGYLSRALPRERPAGALHRPCRGFPRPGRLLRILWHGALSEGQPRLARPPTDRRRTTTRRHWRPTSTTPVPTPVLSMIGRRCLADSTREHGFAQNKRIGAPISRSVHSGNPCSPPIVGPRAHCEMAHQVICYGFNAGRCARCSDTSAVCRPSSVVTVNRTT